MLFRSHQVLLGVVDAFLYSIRHFLGFAETVTDDSVLITYHHDGGEGELGDRDRIGGRGARDREAALPARRGHGVLHRAGGVGEESQVGHPVQHLGAEDRAAPAADDDLDVGQDVIVEGGVAGTLTLSMSDAAIDPDGGWLKAPYGSTAASLSGVLRIEPATFAYDPANGRQAFQAMLSVDPNQVTAPLYGSLAASVIPTPDPGAEGATVTAVAAVELQIVAAPEIGRAHV